MEQESPNREPTSSSCHSPNDPILCTNGCGFFGTPSNMNLCSKCYADVLKNLESLSISEAVSAAAAAAGKGKVVDTQQEPAINKPANRCSFCRKRVGLLGFKCRCEQTFCSVHRFSDQHECSVDFDYEKVGREEIARANPVVKAAKIDRI